MIIFKSVKWKNLLSTGNVFTKVDLTKSTNTLIIGDNGAGKSTILDALCFGLFGKPFRKINKPNLMNSINNKECVVEIEFEISQKNFKVIRGMKPNVFEIYCNGDLINQDAKSRDYQQVLESNILKLNYKSFTQVVILGSASFVPFMQLSAADRRAIIEDLLDIQIFSSMNNLVKDRISEIKSQTQKNKYEMNLVSEKIKLQKQNIEEHRKLNNDEIEKKKSEIESSQIQSFKLQNDVSAIQTHTQTLLLQVQNEASVRTKSRKMLQMDSKIRSNLSKILKEIDFLESNETCYTCHQTIDRSFAETQLTERNKKKDEIESGLEDLAAEMEKTNESIRIIEQINIEIIKNGNKVSEINATIREVNKYINKLQDDIDNLLTRKENLTDDSGYLKELKEELEGLLNYHESMLSQKHYYDYAATLLKDTGIKTKIIKQYLPIMNKLINKYLNSMNFFVNFNINENFEETIKSRHRDEFSYANFSEGEKMRIDLALLFTWRQIAKLKNSTNTNLLILDEVFDSSLDKVGTDDFLKLIHEIGSETNVFVISHKGDQLFDKFRSVFKFEKKGNFSRISKK